MCQPAHTDIDILPAEIINIIHSLFYSLTVSHIFHQDGGLCAVDWDVGSLDDKVFLSLSNISRTTWGGKFFIIEKRFSLSSTGDRTADWLEHQQVREHFTALLLGCWLLIIVCAFTRGEKTTSFYFQWNSSRKNINRKYSNERSFQRYKSGHF